jgi:hypothetical protein
MLALIVTRKNLTPPPGIPEEQHGTRRRSGGARREASDRVRFTSQGKEVEGWTLNVSRGGVRVVVEEPLELGGDYEVSIGEDDHVTRPCRIVWVQDEADGQIVGVQFLDTTTGTVPPPTASTDPPPTTGEGSTG